MPEKEKNVFVEKLIPDFKGLGHLNGKALIIDGALSGETVNVYVKKEYKNYISAVIDDILIESSERQEAPCPYFGICGACSLLHLKRDAENKYKDEFFRLLFKNFDGVRFEKSVFRERFGSRTRVRFHKKDGRVGFMKNRTNDVVDIHYCPLLCDELNNALLELKKSKYCDGEYQFTANIKDNRVIVNTLEYHLSNEVFFQSNLDVASSMLEYVCSQLNGENVMDIYSGVGFFAKCIEQNQGIKTIIAIEENKKCLEFAKKNLCRTKYISSAFEKLDVKRFSKIDNCILDPPRNGLSEKAIRQLLKISPKKIIYVSCNIKSNVNDIAKIVENTNYKLLSAKLFDMYPATSHIEAVCCLEKI